MTWSQRQRRAPAILIWGDFDKTRDVVIVSAHFRVLRHEGLGAWNEQRSPLGELETFVVQDRLSTQFACLALFVQGVMRYEKGDYPAAVSSFSHAIAEAGPEISPSHAYFYRARSYSAMGQHQKAISDLTEIIEHEESYPYALNNRAAAYAATGDLVMADLDLSRAIASMPSDPLAYSNRGEIDYRLHMYNQALADCERAVELGHRAVSYLCRANVYDRLGDFNKALADYGRALKLDPTNPYIYFNRAIAFYRRHEYLLAIPDADSAIRLTPSLEAYKLRAESLFLIGRGKDAIADLRTALRLAQTPDEQSQVRALMADIDGNQ